MLADTLLDGAASVSNAGDAILDSAASVAIAAWEATLSDAAAAAPAAELTSALQGFQASTAVAAADASASRWPEASVSAGALQGCLVSRWSATWLVDSFQRRRYVRYPLAGCVARGTHLDQAEFDALPKAPGDSASLSKEESAAACELAGCKFGATAARVAASSSPPPPVAAALTQPAATTASSASASSSAGLQPARWMSRTGLLFNRAANSSLGALEPGSNEPLLIVFGGASVSDMLLNWAHHVRRIRLKFVVACMDQALFDTAENSNLSAVMHTTSSQQGGEERVKTRWKYYRMDPKAFLTMGLLKVRFFATFLTAGFDVLCSDLDVIWLGDPRPWISGSVASSELLPFADVIVSTDVTHGNLANDQNQWGIGSEMNTGMIYLRATPGALATCAAWVARMQLELDKVKGFSSSFLQWWTNDQTFFNEVVHKARRDPTIDPKSQDPKNVGAWAARVRAQLNGSSTSGAALGAKLSTVETRLLGALAKGASDEAKQAVRDIRGLVYRRVACDATAPGCASEGALAGTMAVAVATFPYLHFASGHTYFTQSLQARQGIEPLAVHTTFQFGDTPEFTWGKISRLRERRMWMVDPDSYYSRRGPGTHEREVDYEGYITITGQLVEESVLQLLRDEAAASIKVEGYTSYTDRQIGQKVPIASLRASNPNRHLLLDAFQRRLVVNLVALGRATKRKVVMPRMSCWCDRYWWLLEDCRFPGVHAETQPLPFHCPFDHLYDLEKWVHSDVPFREYSFLDNPRIRDSDRRDVATLRVAGALGAPNASRIVELTAGASYALAADALKERGFEKAFLVEIDARSLELLCEDLGSTIANSEFNKIMLTVLGVAEQIRYCDRADNTWFDHPKGAYDFHKFPLNCTWGFHPPPPLHESDGGRAQCAEASASEILAMRLREPSRSWTAQQNVGMFANYAGSQRWSTKNRVHDLYRKYIK